MTPSLSFILQGNKYCIVLYCILLTLGSCLRKRCHRTSSSWPPLLQNHSLPLSRKPTHLALPSFDVITAYCDIERSNVFCSSKLAPSITARIVGLTEGHLVQISIGTRLSWLVFKVFLRSSLRPPPSTFFSFYCSLIIHYSTIRCCIWPGTKIVKPLMLSGNPTCRRVSAAPAADTLDNFPEWTS